MAKDYQVGRGRPPLHSRFRPGQSGNPKGRPKGTKRVGDLLREVLSRKVSIREGGSARKVTVQEAVFLSIAAKAMKGDHRAAAFLLKALETYNDSSGKGVGPTASFQIFAEHLDALTARIAQQESGREGS